MGALYFVNMGLILGCFASGFLWWCDATYVAVSLFLCLIDVGWFYCFAVLRWFTNLSLI